MGRTFLKRVLYQASCTAPNSEIVGGIPLTRDMKPSPHMKVTYESAIFSFYPQTFTILGLMHIYGLRAM